MNQPVNLTIVYYSATGTIATIAQEMADCAGKAGAEVRLRRVPELAPRSAIESNPAWAAHAAATADVPEAVPDDLVWADAVLMGSPTRFGNVSSQLKQFVDTLSEPWRRGLLSDKVYSGFTSTGTAHGGHETTLLALSHTFVHLGGVIVPPGYTHPDKWSDGNPYGTSHCDHGGTHAVDDTTRAAARVQTERVLRFAASVKAAPAEPAAA
ncbi:NAD(P)H:quinone oxidoreductase [Streptomyces sp. WMMC500]|uniref:NAD(P)H:quinone oxidoreductase n=1 Tax=Streptomyces sp. WMMC500 TaxID=3015154 RepID=UPI00248BABCF|nr:NAD(P)H:quinone oxidoreductase [Streptomyces sp. WMMC500]WBB59657.1 NAD(P)H:quinone oxidoreductase [Streptomyces sp. WMMC500]